MKSLMSLLQNVFADAETWCCTSTTRDFETVTRRVKNEGISFLTICLPTFGKDFERCLDRGEVIPADFAGFTKSGSLPRFLSGLTGLVFDRSSGRLLDIPSVSAILQVRQLTLMFKKVNLECSVERLKAAFRGYTQCDNEVKCWSESAPSHLIDEFGVLSDLLYSDLCTSVDRKVYARTLVPRHGPGNTADRVLGNQKFDFRSWPRRLEEYFPSLEYIVPNSGFYDTLDGVDFVEPDAELPSRVVAVPKTLKTPRIIALEPVAMQYAQQAVLGALVDEIESSDKLSASIGFTDQSPNRDLARLGSLNGGLATIDLSEASDRVSRLLVQRMFRHWPHLAGAVEACRTTRADVPGEGILTLAKFASMGSALCFPVESMVFLTVLFHAWCKGLNRRITQRDVKIFLGQVRVYGDDIIVPVDLVRSTVESLELFGFKVNTSKSFWTGKFRESCGGDYYDGIDVTVTYCRRLLPSRLSDVQEIIAANSLRNRLYRAGFWKSAAFLDHYLGAIAKFPVVLERSPVLGRFSFLGYQVQKMHKHLHSPLVKGFVVVPKPRPSFLDGPGALLKYFLKEGDEPFQDVKHLERHGRPDSVDIKIRWASPV